MSSVFERKQAVENWPQGCQELQWTPRDGTIEFDCGTCGSYEHSEWDCPHRIQQDFHLSKPLQEEVAINYEQEWIQKEESPLWQQLKKSFEIDSGRHNAEIIGDYITHLLQQFDGELNAEDLIDDISHALNIDPIVGSILVHTTVSSDARLKLSGRSIRKAKPAVVPLLHEVTAPLNDIGPLRSARRMRKYEEQVAAIDGTVESKTEYFQHSTIATLRRCLQKCESIKSNMTPRTPKQEEPTMNRLSARSNHYTPRTPKYFDQDFNESDEEDFVDY